MEKCNNEYDCRFFLATGNKVAEQSILKDIPISIIQADYDLLCPPINSSLFSKGLPNIKIIEPEVLTSFFV